MPLFRHIALLILLAVAGPLVAAVPEVTIEVTGVDEPIRDAVVAGLSLAQERGHPFLTDTRVRRLHARAEAEIRTTLGAFGFYQPQVDIALERRAEDWLASYHIEPGEPARVVDVDIRISGEGEDDPELIRWRESFPLRRGQPLAHQPYEEAKRRLLTLARERGYLDSELTAHRIDVYPQRNEAEVRLHFTTGPRYRFGAVRFNDVPLEQELLERYLPFRAGAPYDANVLYDLQARLTDSEFFASADVAPQVEQRADGQVPIAIDLTMRPQTRYQAGVGYGTDTGPRATAGAERRWLNRHGHRAGAELLTSDVVTSAELHYRIPLQRPDSDQLTYSASHLEETTDDTQRRTDTLGAAITHQLETWRRTLSLNYAQESYQVGGSREFSTMLYPGIAFQRYKARNRIFPREGWRLDLAARAAEETLLSSTTVLQTEAHAKYIHSIGPGRLLLRGDIGNTQVPDFGQLPVSLRFFAGGDTSVRGYAYKSLGPADANGEVVGGRNLVAGSVEYDVYRGEHVGFAAFLDAGNAFDDDYALKQGAGFGLRWRFPFGQLRADVASAISEPERPWRFHLSIGPDL